MNNTIANIVIKFFNEKTSNMSLNEKYAYLRKYALLEEDEAQECKDIIAYYKNKNMDILQYKTMGIDNILKANFNVILDVFNDNLEQYQDKILSNDQIIKIASTKEKQIDNFNDKDIKGIQLTTNIDNILEPLKGAKIILFWNSGRPDSDMPSGGIVINVTYLREIIKSNNVKVTKLEISGNNVSSDVQNAKVLKYLKDFFDVMHHEFIHYLEFKFKMLTAGGGTFDDNFRENHELLYSFLYSLLPAEQRAFAKVNIDGINSAIKDINNILSIEMDESIKDNFKNGGIDLTKFVDKIPGAIRKMVFKKTRNAILNCDDKKQKLFLYLTFRNKLIFSKFADNKNMYAYRQNNYLTQLLVYSIVNQAKSFDDMVEQAFTFASEDIKKEDLKKLFIQQFIAVNGKEYNKDNTNDIFTEVQKSVEYILNVIIERISFK